MKNIFFVITILLVLLMGCSQNEIENQHEDEEIIGEQKVVETIERNALSIEQQKDYIWEENGVYYIHSNVILKNNTGSRIKVNSINAEAVDLVGGTVKKYKDNKIIHSILDDGELMYYKSTMSVNRSELSRVDLFDKVNYRFSFELNYDQEGKMRKLGLGSLYGDANKRPYEIGGVISNETEEYIEDIILILGLFDSEGELVTVIEENLYVRLDEYQSFEFAIIESYITEEQADRVSQVRGLGIISEGKKQKEHYPTVEIVDQVTRILEEENNKSVYTALRIKNNYNEPIFIHRLMLEFRDENGRYLGRDESRMIFPRTLLNGEEAFIQHTISFDELRSSEENGIKVLINPVFYKTDNQLEVFSVNIREIDYRDKTYEINGFVENHLSEEIEGLNFAIAFYNPARELMGIDFEVNYSEVIPEERVERIKLQGFLPFAEEGERVERVIVIPYYEID